MFYYAQKAVLHPTAPLFSADTKEVCRLKDLILTILFVHLLNAH